MPVLEQFYVCKPDGKDGQKYWLVQAKALEMTEDGFPGVRALYWLHGMTSKDPLKTLHKPLTDISDGLDDLDVIYTGSLEEEVAVTFAENGSRLKLDREGKKTVAFWLEKWADNGELAADDSDA